MLHFLISTLFINLKLKNIKRLLVTMCVLSMVFVAKESIAQDYPYKANYSSDFQIGNPANSKMILELWKDFDDNAFDRHDYFADTAVMFLPDGSMIRGKDSILAGAKRFRGAMSSSTSTLDAYPCYCSLTLAVRDPILGRRQGQAGPRALFYREDGPRMPVWQRLR